MSQCCPPYPANHATAAPSGLEPAGRQPLQGLGSLVGIVLLLLGPAFGTADGEAPDENRTGAARDRQDQLAQPVVESPTGQTSDHAGDHETLPIPVNRELPNSGGVQLFADSAHVVIRWDADPNPAHVRAQWSLDGPSGNLLLGSRGGETILHYVAVATLEGYPVIELHLTPTQRVAVHGSSLSVDALGPSQNDSQTPDAQVDPSEPLQLEIETVRSDLALTDIPHLIASGEETVLFASGGVGPWTIDLQGGRSEITGHRGGIDFTGQHTEAAFEGVHGALNIESSESALFIRKGTATVDATTTGGSVDCEETLGKLTISGASTSVSLRRVRNSRVTLIGDDLYVNMEDGRGSVGTSLARGHLSASGWTGRIDLTVRDGATATIQELEGDIAFDASDGASVRIVGVTGHVRGKARGAVVEASSLKSIQLQAWDSDITLQETRTLKTFDLTDSTAQLNLYELRGEPVVSLQGSSRADIDLHYPCQVRAEGPGAANSGRISVDGCENLRPDQRWSRPRARRRGEKPVDPIHLSIKMGQRADVSVRGY